MSTNVNKKVGLSSRRKLTLGFSYILSSLSGEVSISGSTPNDLIREVEALRKRIYKELGYECYNIRPKTHYSRPFCKGDTVNFFGVELTV